MNDIVKRMNDFLKMDTELEFGEFSKYYKDVMAYLQEKYQEMTQEDMIKMSAVLQIVAANALDRSNKKDQNHKKFKKMVEKCQFWFNAIQMRCRKEFKMTPQDFDAQVDAIFQDVDEA